MHVQQLSEPAQLSLGYGVANFKTDVLYLAEAGNDGAVTVARGLILLLQDRRGIAHLVGIEHENVVLETFDEVYIEIHASCGHPPIGLDIESCQAAESGHVLILLANWFPQYFQLNVTGFLGEFLRRSLILQQRMHG